jgi:hypothetical protein
MGTLASCADVRHCGPFSMLAGAGLAAAFSARAQAPGQSPARLSPRPHSGRGLAGYNLRFKLEPPFPYLPSKALNNRIFDVAIFHIGRIRAPLIVPLDTQLTGSRRRFFAIVPVNKSAVGSSN